MGYTLCEVDPNQELEFFRREARDDLLFYTSACNPQYICSRVHRYVAQRLQSVFDGRTKRLIISLPPRTGKSQLVSIEFPTWVLGRRPDTRIVLASYGQDLANYGSKEARRRLGEESYHALFDTRVADGDSQVSAWRTTQGGGYKAVGIGGPLTGFGANIAICDDYAKDFQEAHSKTTLDAVEDWFRSVLLTRLSPDGAVIVMATRWSRGDLIGRLTDPETIKRQQEEGYYIPWEVVNLPALAHDDDPIGRKEGESLFPERFSEDWYKEKRSSVGSYVWSALYEGSPVARGGNYIPTDMIDIVEENDVPKGLFWYRYWDLAASDKSTADYTAGISAAEDEDGVVYLKDLIRGQWAWPQARGKIALTASAELGPVGVEAVSGFKTAFANLQEVIDPRVTLREYGVDKDKLTRALPWIARAEKKKLKLVRGSWNMDFIREAEAFPSGTHDDIVDCVSGVHAMIVAGKQMPIALNINDKYTRARDFRRVRSIAG